MSKEPNPSIKFHEGTQQLLCIHMSKEPNPSKSFIKEHELERGPLRLIRKY